MKVLKKLGVMGLVLGLTMGAVGCSNGSEDKKDDSAKGLFLILLYKLLVFLKKLLYHLLH